MNSLKPPREIRIPLGGPQSASPDRKEIPRIVRLLALAHRWHRLTDGGEIENQAEIAPRTGLTRARVTQILGLAYLPPKIQELALNSDVSARHGLAVRQAIAVTCVSPVWHQQLAQMHPL